MRRLLPAGAALLSGCAAPTLLAAHSLDQGEIAAGVATYGRYSAVDATLIADDGQRYGAEPTLLGPQDPSHVNLDVRVGLGHGLELGTRGIPLLSATDLKWSFLDERRHQTPLSMALDLEVGVDQGWQARPRLGLLVGSTLPLSQRVALAPGAGAWVGPGGFGYEVRLDPALQSGQDRARLSITTKAVGVATPVGLAVPLRLSSHLALAPWAAWVGWWDADATVEEVTCQGCSASVDELQPVHGSFIWGGVRVQPWLEPARRQP